MSTKLRGDIAEQAVSLEALRRDWDVLQPIGDRLPYDLVLTNGRDFHRIQVKWAWLADGSYKVDNRNCKTNRKVYRIERYKPDDFDFAIAYINDHLEFYVMPAEVFLSYGGGITL